MQDYDSEREFKLCFNYQEKIQYFSQNYQTTSHNLSTPATLPCLIMQKFLALNDPEYLFLHNPTLKKFNKNLLKVNQLSVMVRTIKLKNRDSVVDL